MIFQTINEKNTSNEEIQTEERLSKLTIFPAGKLKSRNQSGGSKIAVLSSSPEYMFCRLTNCCPFVIKVGELIQKSIQSYFLRTLFGPNYSKIFINGSSHQKKYLKKVVPQQQITLIFNKRKQPLKIFLPKSCSPSVIQILEKYQ